MSHSRAQEAFPRVLLWAAAALIAASIVTAGAVRVFGLERSQVPQSPAVAVRDLAFEDVADGSVLVRDAASGATLGRLAPGADNFIRGTLRSFVRERRQHGMVSAAAFRLSARADGRLTLEDLATGRQVGLEAFGVTNARAFARFLVADSQTD
jgi:putative photosynthetic complex assembly protein